MLPSELPELNLHQRNNSPTFGWFAPRMKNTQHLQLIANYSVGHYKRISINHQLSCIGNSTGTPCGNEVLSSILHAPVLEVTL